MKICIIFAALNRDSYLDADDPYPSLSDNHDYEPNLEFDDSELLNTDNGKYPTDYSSLQLI